jgi:hypothetical protein
MPPYSAVKSKAQSRLLFAKAARGEGISMEDARGKTRAANFKKLPDRVKKKKVKRAPKRAARY